MLTARQKYYLKNKNKCGIYAKKYYLEHKQKALENNRKYRLNNPEKNRETDRKYRLNNPEKIKAKAKRYYFKHIFENYGFNNEKLKILFDKQKGKCGICGENLTKPKIDHCHKTNKIRGLLCNSCNVGLGFFKDDKKLLKLAIKYLS